MKLELPQKLDNAIRSAIIAVLGMGCVSIEPVPVNNSMSATAGKELIDLFANNNPAPCGIIEKEVLKQATRYVKDPEAMSSSATSIDFADGRTQAWLEVEHVRDNIFNLTINLEAIDESDQAGMFVGSVSAECTQAAPEPEEPDAVFETPSE